MGRNPPLCGKGQGEPSKNRKHLFSETRAGVKGCLEFYEKIINRPLGERLYVGGEDEPEI